MKRVLLSALCCAMMMNASAQKYMTRTGKITFFSSTKVENIEAINNEASAVLDAANGSIVVLVPIKSFRFEKQLMQEHFNENYMESDKYPKAEFKGKVTDMTNVNLEKDGVYKVTAEGKLTMHGVTKDVAVPGTITVKGKTATVNTVFQVKPAEYNIDIPKLVSAKIAESIEITINSILTPAK